MLVEEAEESLWVEVCSSSHLDHRHCMTDQEAMVALKILGMEEVVEQPVTRSVVVAVEVLLAAPLAEELLSVFLVAHLDLPLIHDPVPAACLWEDRGKKKDDQPEIKHKRKIKIKSIPICMCELDSNM